MKLVNVYDADLQVKNRHGQGVMELAPVANSRLRQFLQTQLEQVTELADILAPGYLLYHRLWKFIVLVCSIWKD